MPKTGKDFMEINQRLSERLDTVNRLGQEDTSWYHFVRDHKKYLKRRAKIVRFAPEEIVKYRYRPQDFYVDKCNGAYPLTWIFLLVNDIRNPADFNENHTKFFIVSRDDIENIYNVYSTSENRPRD